jgi:glycosyltransferase involved in cell wall biosynthesis
MLTVLSLPHYSGSNPYQALLNGALERRGVRFLSWKKQVRLSHLRAPLAARALPDILHQQWIHVDTLRPTLGRSLLASALFFCQIAALRLARVKIVWTLHNKCNHSGAFPRLDWHVRRTMCRLAHAVIVHSEGAREAACAYFRLSAAARAKLCVVPHAGYAGHYPNKTSRPEARARFGLAEDQFCFGFIGRLEPYKGIEEAVQAFRALPGAHLRLLIAGQAHGPDLLRWLQEQAAADPRILLHPRRIAEEELQFFFGAADIIVYPFREQLTSGSVLTAASFGRGLVLPNLPGVNAGLPERGRLLYQAGNLAALSEAMRQASLSDAAEMGAANRAAMEAADRSWDVMADRTLAVYHRVLASGLQSNRQVSCMGHAPG